MIKSKSLLKVQNVTILFRKNIGVLKKEDMIIRAVDGISFDVEEGEILGIAGESGSGKSTLAKSIAGLLKPTSGIILFEGENIYEIKGEKYRYFRKNVQMVFQNPFGSLNPSMKIRDTLKDVLKAAKKETNEDVLRSLMEFVNLNYEILDKYPSELSGGQAQRVAIARAIATQPKLLILDEPTSALDVSVQAQILTLLKKIQTEKGLTYILISHDIGVIRYLCKRVIVMKAGKIVEQGDIEDIIYRPKEEYTKRLVESLLRLYGYIEN